uniref:Uncharacterized protein n=1 Tax=Chromera velia CCMP2878 TaxID=1169474 RepID=A0A0G4GYR5_9ALVE|eukprot:Cvel_23956.t1-p1 / transcript=Cvel_23956.t1 / gene=Cvel_23956 / organism=Chromera_velia_CCMP2878 / gene_product=hypothetical protein / transcript_product=hypothetical protein / location=Cvel_scaffold2532:11311-13431(+) / protein_length=707 / sequence_SO=supercontig / SO=protein_coding / is_pseudo=false
MPQGSQERSEPTDDSESSKIPEESRDSRWRQRVLCSLRQSSYFDLWRAVEETARGGEAEGAVPHPFSTSSCAWCGRLLRECLDEWASLCAGLHCRSVQTVIRLGQETGKATSEGMRVEGDVCDGEGEREEDPESASASPLLVTFRCLHEALLSTRWRLGSDRSIFYLAFTGAFALVEVSDLARFVGMGGQACARQILEEFFPSLHVSRQKLLEILESEPGGGEGFVPEVFCLSYGWHAKGNPDPTRSLCSAIAQIPEFDCDHAWEEGVKLRKDRGDQDSTTMSSEFDTFSCSHAASGLTPFLSWLSSHFQTRSLSAEDHGHFLFWDFLSLHQRLPHRDRTPIEKRAFRSGLSHVSTLYGNEATRMVRFAQMPPAHPSVTNRTPYTHRGWTVFESRVAGLKRQAVARTVQIGSLPPDFLSLPLSPPDFTSLLDQHHDNGEEVIRFSNGFEDRPRLKRFYERYFAEAFGKKKTLSLARSRCVTEREATQLASALLWAASHSPGPDGCLIKTVELGDCEMSRLAVCRLLSAAAELPSLRVLRLPEEWKSVKPEDRVLTDETLQGLALLTSLTELQVCGPGVGDGTVALLSEHLSSLQSLSLRHASASARSLMSLVRLRRLERIDLEETETTDELLSGLAKKLPLLTDIGVANTKVTEKGLVSLLEAENLESLCLCRHSQEAAFIFAETTLRERFPDFEIEDRGGPSLLFC